MAELKLEFGTLELPKDGTAYILAGRAGLCSTVMALNGRDPVPGEGDTLPDLSSAPVSGNVILPPTTCVFIVL